MLIRTLLIFLFLSLSAVADPWKGYPYNSSEIPSRAEPDEKILKHYLKKYISARTKEDFTIKVKANDDYKKLNFELITDFDYDKIVVDKQMDKSAMLSYLMYEDGNVVIDVINEKYKKNFKNKTLYVSNSVGKSLVSYITGHAICKGYIGNIHQPIDWDVLENTLYEGQPILNLLNMASGDQQYVSESMGFRNSKRWVNSVSIKSVMKKELKNSKVGKLKYNYSNVDTNIVISYLVAKMGNKEFKKMVKEILVDKVGIEYKVNLFRKHTYGSFVSRYDYLRISIAMLEDWNNNTCEGQYLKSLYENKIQKGENDYGGTEGFNITTSYAGQFHTDIEGIENRPIFVMDGFGGQSHVIDFERNRIISIMAIHRNYDWKKLVYKKIH
tara:strand:+ start:381 stop:1532 length:1152 start_codon:yes stop_codon:yes gene_type:complete